MLHTATFTFKSKKDLVFPLNKLLTNSSLTLQKQTIYFVAYGQGK